MGGGSGVIENNEKAESNARKNWMSFIIGCHPQLADPDMDHVTIDC
jgi:hypothetical protein